jgi:DNA-binding transcriptional LysR family regulator
VYDVHRLRLLRELSHRGTLAAVAEALGYSPSAISHQLGILERETGATLLEPAGRGVRLTPAAVALVARTEIILRELERAEADIAASRREVTGTVRVATFQTAAHTLVLDAIDRLAQRRPQLTVTVAHLDAAAAIPALMARDFDVVLSEDYPGAPSAPHPGVSTTTLAEDPLLLAVPAAWPARALSELAEAAWVMEHSGTVARSWSTARCREAGFEPRVRFETADLHLQAAIVARRLAAAFVPRLGHVPSPGIRLVETGHSRRILRSTRTGSGSAPAISALLEALSAA